MILLHNNKCTYSFPVTNCLRVITHGTDAPTRTPIRTQILLSHLPTLFYSLSTTTQPAIDHRLEEKLSPFARRPHSEDLHHFSPRRPIKDCQHPDGSYLLLSPDRSVELGPRIRKAG